MAQGIGQVSDRVLLDGFWEYNRFYGSWKPGKYLFPIDEEEVNRMDIFHKFFLVARKGALYTYPILNAPRQPRILDLGTGSSIWAINVAEDFLPDADILAVDLNQIQPQMIPRNVRIMQFDIEESSWEPLIRDCDLIHLRMLLGSIHNTKWEETYRKIFHHLRPSCGYIEQLEIDWIPQWEGDDVPQPSALKEWSQEFLKGMDRYQKSARVVSRDVRRMMEAVGFTDFQEQIIKCYVNPWKDDVHEQDVAQWFNLGLGFALEAMSYMPMIKKLGKSKAIVDELCERARRESRMLRYHAFFNLHIWTAKRP